MLNNGFWNPLCICVYFLGLLYILDSNLELDGHASTAIPLIRIHSIYNLAAHFESLYLFINITHIFQLIDCSIFEKFFVYDLMSYYLWIHILQIEQHSAEVNANAAEVLMAIIRNTSSALAAKLSSQRYLSCYSCYKDMVALMVL